MAVHAVRLDERHGSGDAAEQRLVDLGVRWGVGRRRRSHRGRGRCRRHGWGCGRSLAVSTVAAGELEQPLQSWMAGDQLRRAALEQSTPLLRHRIRVLEVVLQQEPGVPGVESVDVVRAHSPCCSSAVSRAGSE